MSNQSTKKFTKKILLIVMATNVFALVSLPVRFEPAIGWIAGTIGSTINFYLLHLSVQRISQQENEQSRLSTFKTFYLRFLFLVFYSVAISLFLKPDILSFGLGLISVQMVIYLYHAYSFFFEKKDGN